VTTTAERGQKAEAPERETEERGLSPLLLAALMQRREARGESIIEHPLLLAALMQRREEGGESIVEHPLLFAALAGSQSQG
jgi:hypothetical protein